MKKIKRNLPILFIHLLPVIFGFGQNAKTGAGISTAQSQVKSQAQTIDGHPAWILEGNIYEVNVRQYTKEGTFNAFAKHLPRLRQMGVQTLWLMPVNPIGKKDRKGALGSYYSVANYRTINPEFGTLPDFKQLVSAIHALGMKVIIDWVPNHTGADHPWLKDHPDFYIKDNSGQAAVPYDWTDTRQLDYQNEELQDSMIASMKYWIRETGIDGFRCDVAWNVPASFWNKCIPALRRMKNIFMLAEGDKPYLPASGFDATYPWELFHMMEKIAKGERPAFALDSIISKYDTVYPRHALQMYFTSNHDENSWNQADFGDFPGPVHAPFAVFTQTMPNEIPLIYSGQEEPILWSIKFFDKDTLVFRDLKRALFYQALLSLRKRSPALAAYASFRKLEVGNDQALYAFVREKAGSKVVVILNLSNQEQPVEVRDKTLWGHPYNVFMGKETPLNGKKWLIGSWGYAVYEYGK